MKRFLLSLVAVVLLSVPALAQGVLPPYITGTQDQGKDSIDFVGIQRLNQTTRAAGLPIGGGKRPFGFEPDYVTKRAEECAILASAAERRCCSAVRFLVSTPESSSSPTEKATTGVSEALMPWLASSL